MLQPGSDRPAQILTALLALCGLAIAAGLFALTSGKEGWGLYLAGGSLSVAVAAFWMRQTLFAAQQRNLERLISGIEAAAVSTTARLPAFERHELDALSKRLLEAAAALVARSATPAVNEARLAAILGALPQPLIVVNAQGLISLANQPARDLLGAPRVHAGTSVFDAFDYTNLASILAQTTEFAVLEADVKLANGQICSARLRALSEHGGAVIVLSGPLPGAGGLVQALELHEPVPERQPPSAETPLPDLSVVVLDCETTGLNVGLDRILSLATVSIRGGRILREEIVDLLFDPGEPIPPASTAIHGITDAMVKAERPLAARWAEIGPLLRDCVVVGHNIGFDLTLLENELRRAGIAWQRPLALDTLQLVSALDPQLQDLNLEAVAKAYGIVTTGRHTALGDALMTAEVYLHLAALMQARGDRTFADAQARAATARRVIRQQQEAGW